MKRKLLIKRLLFILLFFAATLQFGNDIYASEYIFTEIEDPDYPSDYFTSGTGITDDGKIVGYNSGGHSFIIDGSNFNRFE